MKSVGDGGSFVFVGPDGSRLFVFVGAAGGPDAPPRDAGSGVDGREGHGRGWVSVNGVGGIGGVGWGFGVGCVGSSDLLGGRGNGS